MPSQIMDNDLDNVHDRMANDRACDDSSSQFPQG